MLDENHAHELAKASGGPSPALARIPVDTLSLNGAGEIWGVPDWTAYGTERHSQGAYLGVSPAFIYDASTADSQTQGTITGLSSAGLVNEPNLNLPVALNAAGLNTQENTFMDPKEIRELLKLAPDATDAEVTEALRAVAAPEVVPVVAAPLATAAPAPALNAEEPPAWAVALNAKVDALAGVNAASAADAHKVAVNAAIEGAISEGKLPPTAEARAFAEAQCADATALNSFVAYYASAPKLIHTAPALNSTAPGVNAPVMDATEKMLFQASGLSREQFDKPYEDE